MTFAARPIVAFAAAATAASAAPESASRFHRVLAFHGVRCAVTCDNDSSVNQLSIVPARLSIDNQAITQRVDGQVVGADVEY